MMWKSYFFTATALGLLGCAKPQSSANGVDTFDATPRLRFEKDGTFKMSIFEDLHLGEGEDNRESHGPKYTYINTNLPCQRQNGDGDQPPI